MLLASLLPLPASSLIFASPETEPSEEVPPDFPYWDHVTQRRYQGPTVIYLGGGWALTARHVGQGEIGLGGVWIPPVPGSNRTLLNPNGSAADAMVFALESSLLLPDLPLLPIAREPLRRGEEVLLIGFGRERAKVMEWQVEGRVRFGFVWSDRGRKRWGTNRVESTFEVLTQKQYVTRAVAFDFDEPFSPGATRHEAQAAVGDSGGAVFVLRDGRWELAAMMVSVAADVRAPDLSSGYGDSTFAADLTHYREEILRWTRPACANERDDDGDERVDFPDDPDCRDALDRDERPDAPWRDPALRIALAAMLGIVVVVGGLAWRVVAAQRGTSTPSSTSP